MPIASPCVRNCCLDNNDVCLGCGRTVQEVMDWSEVDDKQKLQILLTAKQRRLEKELQRKRPVV